MIGGVIRHTYNYQQYGEFEVWRITKMPWNANISPDILHIFLNSLRLFCQLILQLMANLKCGELLSYTSYIVYYGLKYIHNATGHDNGHDIARPIN